MKTNFISEKKGFTLFIAIAISGAVLVGSYAVSNVVYNQIVLSGSQRESLKAFVAADNGLECAQYYDKPSTNAFSEEDQYGGVIECSGNLIAHGEEIEALPGRYAALGGVGLGGESIFEVNFPDTNTCAVVTVTKTEEGEGEDLYIKTVIVSKGYNTCDIETERRLERALRLTY